MGKDICSFCGHKIETYGNLKVTTIANEKEVDTIDAKEHNIKLCEECAIQIQHDIFHMFYDIPDYK